MFEYHTERDAWLFLPKVAQYRYGRGGTKTDRQEAIVRETDIELAESTDSVEIDGEYIPCCTVYLRSGRELTIALSVEQLGNLLSGESVTGATS